MSFLKFLLGTFYHFLEGSQLFLVTAGKLVSKVFAVFSVKIIHFLEGSQHEVMAGRLITPFTGRLVSKVFKVFCVNISPLPGGKPALPGDGREAG